MKQLTKIQITTRDDLAEAIRHARAALDDTIRTYNDAVTSAQRTAIRAALDGHDVVTVTAIRWALLIEREVAA
jgi:hypothetical protein